MKFSMFQLFQQGYRHQSEWLKMSLQAGITVFIVLFITVLLSACSKEAEKPASQRQSALPAKEFSKQVYQVLLAEYYYQQHDYQQSNQIYSAFLVDGTGLADGSGSADGAGYAKRTHLALTQRSTELAIKTENYDQALSSAQQWKKLEPDSSDVNQFLVLLYQKKGQYVESAEILADLVKAYPTGKASPIDIAVALLEQQADVKDAYYTLKNYVKNHSKAKNTTYYLAIFGLRARLFEEVLTVSDHLDQIENKELQRKTALLRVKVYTAMNKPEKALEELKKLIAEAADPVTRQTYARLMASLGKGEQAVALLEQAYEDHPEKAELLLDMISINLGDERYAQTLPLLDKLQKIDGHKANARFFRGVVFEAQDKFAEALKTYQLIDEEDQSMRVFSRIAVVLKKTGGLDSAVSYLNEKQKQPSNAKIQGDLYLLESELLREADHFKQALIANQKAEKLAPMDVGILYSQALLYEDINQLKKSEEKLLKIIDIDSNNTSALNALGYMLSVHTTRFDEAYRYIKRAYDLKPNDPAIIDSLGWISYRKGDLKGAEKYLRLAYQQLQDPEVASHLVEVLTKQGQQKEAATLLKEMLKKHPKSKQLKKAQALIKSAH